MRLELEASVHITDQSCVTLSMNYSKNTSTTTIIIGIVSPTICNGENNSNHEAVITNYWNALTLFPFVGFEEFSMKLIITKRKKAQLFLVEANDSGARSIV